MRSPSSQEQALTPNRGKNSVVPSEKLGPGQGLPQAPCWAVGHGPHGNHDVPIRAFSSPHLEDTATPLPLTDA